MNICIKIRVIMKAQKLKIIVQIHINKYNIHIGKINKIIYKKVYLINIS